MAPRRYNFGKRAAALEEMRRRIVEATVTLHAEKGVLATSMEDIARRADVAVGTVYRHFPALDDIVRACTGHVAAVTQWPTPQVVAGVEPLSQRVEILLRELFAYYQRAAPWIQVGRCEAAMVPALAEAVRRFDASLEALVREALRPMGGDERVVRTTMALADFYVWKSLGAGGIPTETAAELVSEVLLAWLGPQPNKEGRWEVPVEW